MIKESFNLIGQDTFDNTTIIFVYKLKKYEKKQTFGTSQINEILIF